MELVGKQFDRLTVLARSEDYVPSPGQRQRQWLCLCQCGKTTIARTGHLTRGATKSCGCGQHRVKHGMAHTDVYSIWTGMKQRCTNPLQPEYKNYGGRGISVCDRWLSFQSFYEDVGPRPSTQHELDRINNNGNYEPSNCRWATRQEQCSNQRRNVMVQVCSGELLPRHVAARRYGIAEPTLRNRLKSGWDVRTALKAPPGYNYRKLGPLQDQ